MKAARLTDVLMSYREAGAGDQVLLLVHGFPLDHTMWEAQLDALSDEFRVIAPDLRGFGRTLLTENGTQDPTVTVTMRQYADDLAQLLNALEIHVPVTFCGLSMGGYIGWQFAQAHRDRLRRLILCDTKAVADTVEAAEQRHQAAEKVLAHGPEFLAEAMLAKLLSANTAEQFPLTVRRIREMILGSSPQGIAAAQRGMAQRPDVTMLLPLLDLPSLLIVGSEDVISPPVEMRGIAEKLPNATFVEIAGAGHLAPLEKPDEVNRAIREFMHRD